MFNKRMKFIMFVRTQMPNYPFMYVSFIYILRNKQKGNPTKSQFIQINSKPIPRKPKKERLRTPNKSEKALKEMK